MIVLLSMLLGATAIAQEPALAPGVRVSQDADDPIQPTKISHKVDEFRDGAELLERYNYIVYEFEDKDGYVWARTYLDEPDKVAVYGPFTDRGRTTEVAAPQFREAVLSYLKRRFHRIDRFSMDSKKPAYETIWRRSPEGD